MERPRSGRQISRGRGPAHRTRPAPPSPPRAAVARTRPQPGQQSPPAAGAAARPTSQRHRPAPTPAAQRRPGAAGPPLAWRGHSSHQAAAPIRPERTKRSPGTHKRVMQRSANILSNKNNSMQATRSSSRFRAASVWKSGLWPALPVLSILCSLAVPLCVPGGGFVSSGQLADGLLGLVFRHGSEMVPLRVGRSGIRSERP